MVPRSPFKSNDAAASRQKELQKTMCVSGEKRLDLGKLYELAELEAASKKKEKDDVVLYVRVAKGLSSGKDTFKASTRPKKISTAKVAELEAVEWFENSIKPMLNKRSMYSPEVQQALADIVYCVAEHKRVVLNDPKFLSLLKVVAQAKRLPPERKCPAIPLAVLQPSAGVADIPPPIVTSAQPKDEANLQVLQARLTASLDRIYDDMRSRGETKRPLTDSQGNVVAQLSIRARQAGTSICLDEAHAGDCPQGHGLVMGATSKKLYVRKVELPSLEEAKAVSQATHWLALAQRFESEMVSPQPQVFALNTTMNHLLTQMEKNGQQKLELRDDHGNLLAVASVCRNDEAMRLLLCIDEPVSGAWAGPGTQGVSVRAGHQLLNWHGTGPKSEAQNERVARFLKLAQGFDAQILAGPKVQPVTVQAKSSEALNTKKALAQQLALMYDDLLKSNQGWEWLRDENGQNVARIYLEDDQMPPRIVVVAPQGIDSTAPQKMGIAMDMMNKEVYFLEPSNPKPGQFDAWLKLAKRYEFSAAPTTAVPTMLRNEQSRDQAVTPAALTAALHSLSQAMSLNKAINDAKAHRIWLDKAGNVRFDEVIGAELAASAEFVTKSNGDRVLTVQSAYAYEKQGREGLWASVLSPNDGKAPSGMRLNTKADYSGFNASEIQTKVEGLMEFTQKFQNALDALPKVENAV
ncbi:MAG TPA: hypothetical protein VLG41_05225 [Hydrogenophaga sp.]|uniref:hypothetical protein n=1 Tax=Hydrogenophaga sp. TaxID=1904254 RepID=UPI002CDB0967|nr:hypothetical protein [Hydrogenophaga sp.]HSX92301.1 hypothetical protein [Hydrogenophaga sp.]